MGESAVIVGARDIRDEIKVLNRKIWEFVELCKKEPLGFEGANKEEVIANAMLSYRHGEDARMRLGKVLESCGEPCPA